MMKRASVIAVMVALIIGVTTCLSFAAISFRVYGGYSMLNPTKYNDEQTGDYLVDSYGGEVLTQDKLSSAIPLGVDVRFGGKPGLMFSLGFTRFNGKAGFTWEDVAGGESLERRDTISVMGGLGSVLYAVGSGNVHFYFGGGAGYYMVNLEKTVPVEVMWFRDEYEYTAKANKLGFHGLAGFEYFLTKNMALGGEILYRMLDVGEMTFTAHDVASWVDETSDFGLNLSGINILFGLNIYV